MTTTLFEADYSLIDDDELDTFDSIDSQSTSDAIADCIAGVVEDSSYEPTRADRLATVQFPDTAFTLWTIEA